MVRFGLRRFKISLVVSLGFKWRGGRFLNANANGTRVGYAASNAEHMTRVDEFLTKFVHDTQGELMSPSTVSWRRGNKGAKLDHISKA